MNHAARVAIGTAVLTRRALGGSWQSMALRGGAAAYISPYLFAELQPYPYVAPAGLVGWFGAAWWAGRPQAASERPEPSPAEQPAEAPAPATVEVLADAVRALAAGGHGAHYEALAEHLTRTTGRAWDTAAVRVACRAVGIPHCGSVRQPGRSVSTGVRLADLPDPAPGPSPAPAVAVVVAGQDTPTEATTAPATPVELQLTVEEGAGMTIIRDPSERRAYKV
ncbi:hypothetical protein ACFWA6_13960 [Streptomyces sp. NPDC060020]|uniref:hypothetical protein n=1 Tax=Streptomyces sp. NPDC060020 TaxID=3347038 RepID=UPI003684A2A8